MTEELLPCPFCGSKAKRYKTSYGHAHAAGCGTDGCPIAGKAYSLEGWNTRANRWAAFSDGELNLIYLEEMGYELEKEMRDELERRKK